MVVNRERQNHSLEVNAVTKSVIQVMNGTQRIEQEIADLLQDQTSIEKGVSGTKKDGARIRALIHEKVIRFIPQLFFNIFQGISNIKHSK